MKKVILANETTMLTGTLMPLNYKEQLLGLIISPPDGMNLAEMRNIEKVYDKLREAECPGCMLLEDAEHATLEGILRTTKFRVFDKDIKCMIESVLEAAPVEVSE